MSPTRRVLLGIGALVAAMVALALLSWHLQTAALSDALVKDVEASMAQRVALPAGGKHENGYACFAEVMRRSPKDLSPVDNSSRAAFSDVMDGGVMPETWQAKLVALEPWAESLRDCGDAQALQFLPATNPYIGQNDRGVELTMALSRLTRLQVRALAADAQWEEISRRCAATLEVTVDRSYLTLVGAMVAASTVKGLAPPCGEALQRVGPEARARLAPRFEALLTRLAPNHVLAEQERVMVSLSVFGFLLDEERREKLPAGERMYPDSLANRFVLARAWSRHDRALRAQVAAADAPGPARAEASLAVDQVFNAWWLPPELRAVGSPNYEKFFARNEETAALLRLLANLAFGDERPLPAGITRTSEGFELTTFEGNKVLVPLQ